MIMQPDILSREETFLLGEYELPRLFNGLWQLSSNSWGSAPAAKIRRQMATYAENGYTAFGEYSASAAFKFCNDDSFF